MEYDIDAIIKRYSEGYFLMANHGEHGLDWYSSRKRALMPIDERFHYPRSLQRVLNQKQFSVAINRDFAGVVEGCADRITTWISQELKEIYLALNETGWAYSFETWQDNQLAGGVLGIVIGGVFIGESMFYHIPNGSKVALVKLVELLRRQGFLLFDVQMNNPHLDRFGAYHISDRLYKPLLRRAIECKCDFHLPDDFD